ncbi:MAG: hypothetical protein FJ096_06560 [Deltaproteobacteria bacterium]|nr:hypothetical protein [Deltaproteobacteria bacterium]
MTRALALTLLTGSALFAACAEPTQVTVVLSTNARCSAGMGEGDSLVGVDVFHGRSLAEAPLTAPNASTDDCTPGLDGESPVGTLVLVPGTKEPVFELLVVAAVRRPDGTTMTSGQCAELVAAGKLASFEEDGGKKAPCIVARRRLAFIESRRLTLPVELDTLCVGVECGKDRTCSNGSCVDANVVCDSGLCGPGGGTGGTTSVATSVTASVGSVVSSAGSTVTSVVSSVAAATSGSGGDLTTVTSSGATASSASSSVASVAASTGSGAGVCVGPAKGFANEVDCMTGCSTFCMQNFCSAPKCSQNGAEWNCTCSMAKCPTPTLLASCGDCAAYCGSECLPACADPGQCNCLSKGSN